MSSDYIAVIDIRDVWGALDELTSRHQSRVDECASDNDVLPKLYEHGYRRAIHDISEFMANCGCEGVVKEVLKKHLLDYNAAQPRYSEVEHNDDMG